MASAGVKAEMICSICMEIYSDPVRLPCEHNFCQKCITKAWKHQVEGEYTCPECNRRYRRRPSLKVNLKLRNISDAFLLTHKESEDTGTRCSYCIHSCVPAVKSCLHCEASLCDNHLATHNKSPEHVIVDPTTSLVNKKCPVHKKILEYYCMEDNSCICAICKINRTHNGHLVVSVTEASKKKQRKCKHIQKKLAKNRDKAEKRLEVLQREKERLTKKAAGETERVTALFRDIGKYLETVERRVLSIISSWEEKASLPVSDLIQQLNTRKDELSKRIIHVEELCNMTDPINVLQETESGGKDFADVEGNEKKADDVNGLHDVDELDEILISLEIHKDLAEIMKSVKKQLHD